MKVSRTLRQQIGLLSVGVLVGASVSGLLWQAHALHAQATPDGLPYSDTNPSPVPLFPSSVPSNGWNPDMGGMPSMYPAPTAMPSMDGSNMVGDPTQSTPSAAEMQLIAPSYSDMMQGMPSYDELQQIAPQNLMQHISQSDYEQMMHDVSAAQASSVSSYAAPSAYMPEALQPTQDAALVQQLIQMISTLQNQITQLQTQISMMQQQAAQASMASVMSASMSSSSTMMHDAAPMQGGSSSSTGWFGSFMHWVW